MGSSFLRIVVDKSLPVTAVFGGRGERDPWLLRRPSSSPRSVLAAMTFSGSDQWQPPRSPDRMRGSGCRDARASQQGTAEAGAVSPVRSGDGSSVELGVGLRRRWRGLLTGRLGRISWTCGGLLSVEKSSHGRMSHGRGRGVPHDLRLDNWVETLNTMKG